MLELIAAVICAAAMIFYGVCILLHKKELKAIVALYSSENPSQIEKSEPKRKKRRATRFTDGSKKWLDNKAKAGKEEG